MRVPFLSRSARAVNPPGRAIVQTGALLGAVLAVQLTVPAPGAVAHPPPNTIGIYTNATDFIQWIDPALMTPFEVTFLLVSPRTAAGEPVAFIDGFEYMARMAPLWSVFRLADNLPAQWTNLGDASSLAGATYRMSGPAPLPVAADAVVLHTWQLMRMGTGSNHFYLQPVDQPTIPGALAFTWPDGAGSMAVAAQPSSGDPQVPVFQVESNCPTDCHAFGAVKALFRR